LGGPHIFFEEREETDNNKSRDNRKRGAKSCWKVTGDAVERNRAREVGERDAMGRRVTREGEKYIHWGKEDGTQEKGGVDLSLQLAQRRVPMITGPRPVIRRKKRRLLRQVDFKNGSESALVVRNCWEGKKGMNPGGHLPGGGREKKKLLFPGENNNL